MNQIFALRRILSTQPRASRRHKDLLKSHREGSALVEMAVVVPLMLTLITGMASFGRGQSRGPRGRALVGRESGQALVTCVLSMTFLMSAMALALDLGYMQYQQVQLQTAADSAALAAGLELGNCAIRFVPI
jgi:Flp pilus assembly protein TadG